jgi:hypothetical protein
MAGREGPQWASVGKGEKPMKVEYTLAYQWELVAKRALHEGNLPRYVLAKLNAEEARRRADARWLAEKARNGLPPEKERSR